MDEPVEYQYRLIVKSTGNVYDWNRISKAMYDSLGSRVDDGYYSVERRVLFAQLPKQSDNLKTEIADALDCFWNPAVGAIRDASYHGPATGSDVVGAIAQGLAAVAERLRS